MKNTWILVAALAVALTSCGRSMTLKTFDVASQTKPCVFSFPGALRDPMPGETPTGICIQVRESGSSGAFYFDSIQGFTHQAGFTYRLLVRVYGPAPYVQDDFGYKELAQILEKTPAQ